MASSLFLCFRAACPPPRERSRESPIVIGVLARKEDNFFTHFDSRISIHAFEYTHFDSRIRIHAFRVRYSDTRITCPVFGYANPVTRPPGTERTFIDT